jgi:hypothetical protein
VCYLGRVYLLLVMHRGKLAELQHLQMWGVGLEPPRHPPLDLQRNPAKQALLLFASAMPSLPLSS